MVRPLIGMRNARYRALPSIEVKKRENLESGAALRPWAISSPRPGRRNISSRGEKERGNDRSGCMVEGETFTIDCILLRVYYLHLTVFTEPILTMGSTESITWDDGWTTVTADGSRAAQFEHTILITRTGAEVLTKC
ncbi:hypothetical protein BHE74_00042324 [Ensete ventricosum]|nr:hypothetical protein GW17_00020487 [Ensete ventricosum]RWW51339.1 hypothetical protein BHE74_00042324 [Ensete ventricosum]